eukprot:806908-Amphidinium_carterae.1
MMRINQATTFDDARQWISNCFNSTYTGTEGDSKGQVGGVSNYDNENYDNEEYNEEKYDENWDYDDNDPLRVAFFRGRAKGQKKGKGTKGDNAKGKEGRTVTCYIAGSMDTHRHFATTIRARVVGPARQGLPHNTLSTAILLSTIDATISTVYTSKATTKAMGNTGTNLGGKKGPQVPVHQINDTDYYFEDPYAWDNSWSQEWYPEADANQQWSGQEVGQVLQSQPSGDNPTSPQTMGSLPTATAATMATTASTTATVVPMTYILTDNLHDT